MCEYRGCVHTWMPLAQQADLMTWLPSAKSSRRRSVGDKRRGDPLGATVGEYTARRQGSPHGPPPFNTPAPVAPGTALVRHGRDARSPLARGSTVDPGTAVIELALVTARPAVGQWLVSHGDLWSWGKGWQGANLRVGGNPG